MESFMIWRLSLCVGFLLAIVVVILIAVVFQLNCFLIRKLKLDMEEIFAECEKCEEVTGNDGEN